MKELYKALADFQQAVPPIYKGTEGYGYSYADWGQILDVISPLLKKHGLGFTQPLDGTRLKTIVFHIESGESIEGSVEIPQDISLAKMNAFQVIGSGITYYRRYSLSAILGLVTDKDADAAGEQVKLSPKERAESRQQVWDDGALARAKTKINGMLTEHGYDTAVAKLAFVNSVLKKEVITTEQDANEVADALENEG